MNKADREMRAEYKRSDFAKLERGKFFKETSKGTSVALIEPTVANTFPTWQAVNEALRGLLALADETAGITVRAKRITRERAARLASAPRPEPNDRRAALRTERGDEPHIMVFARQRSMKSASMRKKPPATPAEWEALVAAAPGKDRALTAAEQKKMAGAVVVKSGGHAAVRAALAQKRRRGERGPQVAPTKQLVSVRYSPEVLQYFKATGSGWQRRMNEALLEWVHKRSARKRSGA